MRTLSTKFAAAIFALFVTAGFGHAQNVKCTSTSTKEFFGISSEEKWDKFLLKMANGTVKAGESWGFPVFGEIRSCILANDSMIVFDKESRFAITWDVANEKLSYSDLHRSVDLFCVDLYIKEKYRPGADGQC